MTQLELPLAPPPARPSPPARPPRRRRPPSARRPEALARLARWLGARLGERRKLRDVAVVFNPRLRTAAGRADSRTRTIELNPRLLDRHPGELVTTLVHELCHVVAGVRAGHGERWRQAMASLGFPPRACHRLDTTGLATRRRAWLWSCTGCAESYRRRHRAAHRYRCGRCGGKLRVAGPAPS